MPAACLISSGCAALERSVGISCRYCGVYCGRRVPSTAASITPRGRHAVFMRAILATALFIFLLICAGSSTPLVFITTPRRGLSMTFTSGHLPYRYRSCCENTRH